MVASAFRSALTACALADRALVVVGPPGDPLLKAVEEVAPDRVVHAVGPVSRVAVGTGVAASGRPVLTLADARTGVSQTSEGTHVIVFREAQGAQRAWAAGLPVILPAWPADAESMLALALGRRGPVALLLHTSAPPQSDAGFVVPAPTDLDLRILDKGSTGVVAAGGALALALPAVGRMLAGRGASVTTVAIDTAWPGQSPDPLTLSSSLLVGPPEAFEPGTREWTEELMAVPAMDASPRALMDAVASHLRIGRV